MLTQSNLPSLWLLPCTAQQRPDVLPDVLSLPQSPQIQQLAAAGWMLGSRRGQQFCFSRPNHLQSGSNQEFHIRAEPWALTGGILGCAVPGVQPPTSRSFEKIQIVLAQKQMPACREEGDSKP